MMIDSWNMKPLIDMAIRMVACNQDIAQKKQIFHYMDLKFAVS